jgi:hypothetical protein
LMVVISSRILPIASSTRRPTDGLDFGAPGTVTSGMLQCKY